ncbi:hypothetical protein DFH07DRAFT_951260 [Mycena maculata]|uniref:Uncharacterized protein n=1 Tax=Mycena maculata TaxID=230809 RepID=A0AAD7NW99_9AGAR|nr:hypothetical protein DFH07DRAFT_951260 [Mycena maculata]
MAFPDFVAMIGKVLAIEVTFTPTETSGLPALDEMLVAQSEYNSLYNATPVPNPDLVALGVKFGTIKEFMETEAKKHIGA